jgi:hypothetical protein
MTETFIKIKLDGSWYIIPKDLLPESELNKFEWEDFK